MTEKRVLWLSNWCDNTGYGNQTRMFVPMLHERGYPMAVAAFWGVEAQPAKTSEGVILLPRVVHPYMNDVIDSHYRYHRADAVVTLIDPFVLDDRIYRDLNWIAWSPIDSTPVLPQTATVLKSAKRIWAMSRFGEAQLRAAGFTNIDYVPHGIDSSVFKPTDKAESLRKLKSEVGLDFAGKFVVVINAANKGTPSRKGFYEAFQAFKAFSDRHDDAVLYVHSEALGLHGGENLYAIAEMVGLSLDKVLFAPQYHYVCGMLPPHFINDIYNVGDVMLHAARGEGFGIPLVEAQMAGLPIIATDFSAMSELNFGDWRVPGLPFMPNTGVMHVIPFVHAIEHALSAAYQQRGNTTLRAKVRAAAMEYELTSVLDKHMIPALRKALGQDEKKSAIRDQNTAQREALRAAAERLVGKRMDVA